MVVIREAKKLAFDVGWVFASSSIVLLLHFFQNPIMARFLGPDGLGLFSMALMLVSIIGLIAVFGIDGALVKFVAEYKGHNSKVDSLASSAFVTVLISGVITSIALFGFSDTLANIFNMPPLSLLLKIYALACPFLFVHAISISFLNGMREMKYYAFIIILQASLALLFILALLMFGLGVVGAMLGFVFAIIVTTSITTIIIKRFIHFTVLDYKKNTEMLASFGSRLVGANAIGQIYQYIDILMIGYFLTSTEVGHYAVAVSLSRVFWLVPRATAIVAYPAISEYWSKNDLHAINKLVDKATKYSACMLVFAGMSVIFFATDIIILLFTSKFLPAVVPLTILIIGTVTSGILRSVGGIFASVGKVNVVLKISAICAVSNIILNMALIPTYGIIGAATATTATYVLNVIITIYCLRKVLAIKLDTSWYTKMAMLIGLSATLFYVLGFLNHYISSMIALLFYAVVVVKYFLTDEDRRYFLSIAKQAVRGGFMKL